MGSARRREDLIADVRPQLQGTISMPWETTLTAAQVKALNTTPLPVTDLPGADRIIIPEFAIIEKVAGSAFTVVGVTDIRIGYGNPLSPAVFSIDEANFLTATVLETRLAYPRPTTGGTVFPDLSLVSATGPINHRNKALYIQAIGADPAGTGSALKIHLYGRIVPVNLTFSW